MSTIIHIGGQEILDSRGRPTVKATVRLKSGAEASASIPSGASTGDAEAIELRDGETVRYGGLGCRRAVAHIEGAIRRALTDESFSHPFDLDRQLIELDGTPNKGRLGANALLSVSLAYARACAEEEGLPLYRFFSQLIDEDIRRLPRLTVNLFSGGLHAGEILPVQDCLVVPRSATTIDDSLAMTYAVYQGAAELVRSRYSMRLLTADEGGLSPDFERVEEMFELAVESIRQAGLRPAADMTLAIDVAASHFYKGGYYQLGGGAIDGEAMVEVLARWAADYPIISIEDGLAEDDWAHWPRLCRRLGRQLAIMGDDLLCTNPQRIRRAIDAVAANALLLKVNQIGTLREAAEALRLAKASGWTVTISARSGETEDNWLADLAVGWGGDFIKVGSINQSERLAKYNRLLEIERETGWPLAPID